MVVVSTIHVDVPNNLFLGVREWAKLLILIVVVRSRLRLLHFSPVSIWVYLTVTRSIHSTANSGC